MGRGVLLRPVEPGDGAFLSRLHHPDVAGPLAWFDDPPEERAGPPGDARDADVENVAEQRALERAGFTREGVLRGAQHRRGRWRDLVLYARLRDDAPAT